MIRVGLLDRIFDFFKEIIFGKEREETGPDTPPEPDIIYQRKIIKPLASERRGNKTLKLFAVTFEDNFDDRAEKLAREILRYAETHDVWLEPDIQQLIGGYDDQSEFTNPPFTWPVIEVGVE